MHKDEQYNIKDLITRDLDINIQTSAPLDEKQLLKLIELRVKNLMNSDFDLLFSYLYRLDIDEKKIEYMINGQEIIPTEKGIAKLILDRQIERISTKKKFKQKPIEGWDLW